MIRSDGAEARDAGQVGLALALPSDLQAQIRAIATEWAPVRDAVAAGWAGLDDLQIVTAALNGAAAVVRPRGAPRETGAPVLTDGGLGPVGEHIRLAAGVEAFSRPMSGGSVDAPAEMTEAFRVGSSTIEGALAQGHRVERPATGRERSRFPVIEDVVSRTGGGADGGAPGPAPDGRLPRVVLEGSAGTAAMRVDQARGVLIAARAAAGAVATEAGAAPGQAAALSAETLGAAAAPDGASAPVVPVAALYADVGAVLRDRARSGVAEPQFSSAPSAEGRAAGSAFVGGGRRGGGGGAAADFGSGPLPAGFGATAAPQPPERSGGDGGGGGTVMLDGRLVGQWLSEHMARDAARPGAGTTFFDPRQAPAWTPSGAL